MTAKDYNVGLIVLQEVRWSNAEHIESDNMTVICSRSDNGRRIRDRYYCERVFNEINKEVWNVWWLIVLFNNNGKPLNIATINSYAPTKAEDNDNKDFFYDNLERLYDIIPKNCIKIIVGNKNAK